MQKSDKSPLATAIDDFVKSKSNADVICKKKTEKFVLDSNFSLHLIPWEKNIRYQYIALKYANYVILGFRSPSVVFDGNPEISATKNNTHKCRAGKGISTRIEFDSEMLFQRKKHELSMKLSMICVHIHQPCLN